MTICLDLRKMDQWKCKVRYHSFHCQCSGQVQHVLCVWMPDSGVMSTKVSFHHWMIFGPVHTCKMPLALPFSGHVVWATCLLGNLWMRGGTRLKSLIETDWLDSVWQGRCMACTTCLLLLPSAEVTIAYSKDETVTPPARACWMPLFKFNAWTNLWGQEDP